MKTLMIVLCGPLLVAIFGILYASSQIQPVESVCKDCGNLDLTCKVSGRVFDENGQPVSGSSVSSVTGDRPLKGRIPFGLTDDKGNFSLDNLKCGINSIFAYKEEDGYADPLNSLADSGTSLVVEVTSVSIT